MTTRIVLADGTHSFRGKRRVIEAENGLQGLKLTEEYKPDLIITDVPMPRKEGIETIREMQERSLEQRPSRFPAAACRTT